jgi:hypothetical protein
VSPLYAVGALALVFAVLFVFGLLSSPPSPDSSLRKQAMQLGRWGQAEGPARLEQRVAELRPRFPGKSEAWLLQWIIDDLRRAKR